MPEGAEALHPTGRAVGAGLRAFPLRPYLQIRPVGFRNGLRLYSGYGVSFFVKLLAPSRFSAVGPLLPGKANLTLSMAGLLVTVRPQTNDLDLLAHHEPEVVRWFRVKPGDVVVDVGAHIGRYTLLAARAASRVVAVEPDPSNFSVLSTNIRINGFSNVVALPLALSRDPGRRQLYPAGGSNRGTSSLEPACRGGIAIDWAPAPVDVDCETLDHLADSLALRSVDWLKIDVEGHEVAVLEGGQATLAKTKHLILEVTQGNEEACGALMKEAGMTLISVERGSPASNWFLEGKG